MSIIVSVKVRDGIVLGADGMSQIYAQDNQGRTGVAQTYKNAKKLFEVSDVRMGIMAGGFCQLPYSKSHPVWCHDCNRGQRPASSEVSDDNARQD